MIFPPEVYCALAVRGKKRFLKIGYSNSPHYRAHCLELQYKHRYKIKILVVSLGGFEEEQELHRRFRDLNLTSADAKKVGLSGREWFRYDPSIIEAVKNLPPPRPREDIAAEFQAKESRRERARLEALAQTRRVPIDPIRIRVPQK